MAKTVIIYGATAALLGLTAKVKPLRDAGQPVRLIALEEFRGETEQNAGTVLIDGDVDQTVRDAIEQAYPHLVVQDAPEEFTVTPVAAQVPREEVDTLLRDLRLRLIRAGGTVPAGASAEELSNLIAAQEANQDIGARTPVMPTPATAGTVIPDSTPVIARVGADALVPASAVGATPEALDMASERTGEGHGSTHAGAASAVSNEDKPPLANLDAIRTHAEADSAAAAEGVDLSGKTSVADKIAAIKKARG